MKRKNFFKRILSVGLSVLLLSSCTTKSPTSTSSSPESKEATVSASASSVTSASNDVSPSASNTASETAKKSLVIGMTVQDLSNQIFAATCESLDKLIKADGGKFTYLDCKSNAATQIQQVENFITNKVDVIIIQPAEANALEDVLGNARSAGIKVFCWDEAVKNADIDWLIDNYSLGKVIGQQAAQWINDKFKGKCEVAVLDYPQLPILLQRGNGITDAIKELAPNAKIVAQSSAINPTEGMNKTETFLQANPNIKVIACIGGGGAVGANEAVKSAGKLTDDFGIFSCDATAEELTAIENNEGNRMTVMITGDANAIAKEIYTLTQKMESGQPYEKKIYRTCIPITKDNVAQYFTKK